MYFFQIILYVLCGGSTLGSSFMWGAGNLRMGEFPLTSDLPCIGHSLERSSRATVDICVTPSLHALFSNEYSSPMHFFGLIKSYYSSDINDVILPKLIKHFPRTLSGPIDQAVSNMYNNAHKAYKVLLSQNKINVSGANFISALLVKDTLFISNTGYYSALLIKRESIKSLIEGAMAHFCYENSLRSFLPLKGLGSTLFFDKNGYPLLYSPESVTPDVVTHTIEENDMYLVFMSPAVAKAIDKNMLSWCSFLRDRELTTQEIAQNLSELAHNNSIVEDASVMVIDLRKHYVRKIIAPKPVRAIPKLGAKIQAPIQNVKLK